MARYVIRVLQGICLMLFLLIVIDIMVGTIKIGPPPIPLDIEGHTAPFDESPGWGIS
jgi:hypothetical protein